MKLLDFFRHLVVLLLCVASFSSETLLSQSIPHAFNYSAVARDSDGNPIAESMIGIEIRILSGSVSGDAVYEEQHLVQTDSFGLFNLVIGGGVIQAGSMESIAWGGNTYFIEIGMDVFGGSDFLVMGTTQLLSVPYALHSKTAEALVGGASGDELYIGQEYMGGIICHLYKDSQGEQRGLVISKEEDILAWDVIPIETMGRDAWDGTVNTALMNASSPIIQWLEELGAGWYLPSIAEMNLAWLNGYVLNQALAAGGYTLLESNFYSLAQYWTSTEVNASSARFFYTDDGDGNLAPKSTPFKVRAMKRF